MEEIMSLDFDNICHLPFVYFGQLGQKKLNMFQ